MAYVTKINGYNIKDSEARGDVSTLQKSMTTAQGDLSDTKADLGNITALDTTVKTSAVNAINEVNGKAEDNADNIGTLSSLTTTDKTDLVSAINEVNGKTPMINTTWSELKALRDGGNLVKGLQYRITDFVTTTAQTDTQSAGHVFDVIVTADSESVLNENARAAIHEGDTYFANSKLQAWKLKYCLDNDTTRFAWADTTNGKGVIYRLIDEKENDLPYDFKNIQFLRYKVSKYLVNEAKWANAVSVLNSQISSVLSLRWGSVSNDSAEEAIDDNSPTWYENKTSTVILTNDNTGLWKIDDEYDMFILGSGESKYFYTFSQLTSDTDEATDSSLLNTVFKNHFGFYKVNTILSLGKNVFIGNSFNCNTVGNNFYCNTVGNDFYYNTVGNSFYYNTVGNSFYYNTVGNDFYYNTVGNSFYYNTVGNDFNSNTVGNDFYYNTVGNSFYYNTVGNSFYSNTVGNDFYYNTVGNSFYYNTVGNSFYSNTVGNYFDSNTVGNDFYTNTVGNYYHYNHIEDGVSKLNFNTSGSSSSYVQKYRVLAGTAPSSAQTVSLTTGNTVPYNIKQTGANTISVEAA